MTDYPFVTIGMTCYNADDTIARAIEGALAQDYPNFEIVIVDDGSKDNSVSVIREMEKSDSRIRFVPHEKNKGFPSALNTLIANARGEYVAIFDDDDESHPDRISKQIETLRAYELDTGETKIACYCSMQRVYPNGYRVQLPGIGSQGRVPVGEDMIRYHLSLDRPEDVFYGCGTPSCSLMARAETFRLVGPYDAALRRNEDSDFVIRLALLGGHFIGTKDVVLTQYHTSGVDKRPEVAYESEMELVEKYKSILIQHGRYDYAKDWLKLRYFHFSGQRSKALLHVILMTFKYPVLTLRRFVKAAPRRLLHEWKLNKGQYSQGGAE